MQFEPSQFIEIMRRVGFEMIRRGDLLVTRPGSRLTDEMKEMLARHKPALITRVPVEAKERSGGIPSAPS